jgi:hypothetical protein
MKTLYCIICIAISVLLTKLGLIGDIAAILILSSALPAWNAAMRAN